MDGAETNTANTIDDCDADGTSGTYKKDESLDAIQVASIDGGLLTNGKTAEITASVFAWSSGASDTADFYYASDASNPSWQYIGSKTPEGGGEQEVKMTYTLPEGEVQAVRVQFRFGGTLGSCSYGSYNDRDDIVFTVSTALGQPTASPVKTLPPTTSVKGGPQQASFDSDLGVPRCAMYGSECDSLDLLDGRGLMNGGNEINVPNTLDSCRDGSSGIYGNDESMNKIVVRSGDIDGAGSGLDMVEGERATISAYVSPWKSGNSDYADFYIASDASNPSWQYIGTKQPEGSGIQELKISYTLPQGTNQAVRVNFRYRGAQGMNGACSEGSYDDTDDLAFAVKTNPSFTGVEVSQFIFREETKDVNADLRKRQEIRANQKRRKRTKTRKQKTYDE